MQYADSYSDSDLDYNRNKHAHYYRHRHLATYGPMYTVFHTVIMCFALFLSFKCNKGFVLFDFLLALFCPVLYILYRAATSPDLCNILPLKA